MIGEYLSPIYTSRERKRRFRRFLLAGDCRYTMEIADKLHKFDKPTMVVWAAEDRFLPVSWGKKLYDKIQGARRFEIIPFTGHLLPEEVPGELAGLIIDFLSSKR